MGAVVMVALGVLASVWVVAAVVSLVERLVPVVLVAAGVALVLRGVRRAEVERRPERVELVEHRPLLELPAAAVADHVPDAGKMVEAGRG